MADRYHIDLGDYSLGRFRNDLETRYVTPSRASLKEDIPERFARIEAQGITNLGQLCDVLKTKKKLADFSVDHAQIELSGGSSGVVNVDGRLDADLSGGSHLDYIGDAELGDIEKSGGSSLNKR